MRKFLPFVLCLSLSIFTVAAATKPAHTPAPNARTLKTTRRDKKPTRKRCLMIKTPMKAWLPTMTTAWMAVPTIEGEHMNDDDGGDAAGDEDSGDDAETGDEGGDDGGEQTNV